MMRKWLIWLMVLCMLPISALAMPDTPYDPSLMLRYHTLTETQQQLFDLVYAAAKQGEETVQLPQDTSYDDTLAAVNALQDDCPELCALSNQYRILYYRQKPECATAVELRYTMSLSCQTQLLETAQALANAASGDAYTKELFLHDALCDRAVYDLEADAQATAYGALITGRAGCEGYARALILLCRLAGIPSGLVTGVAGSNGVEDRHAWCVMYIDGVMGQTDPTWNDQDSMGINTHWYFNLTDEQMGLDHTPDDHLVLPLCTNASMSWHAKNGNVVPAVNGEDVITQAMQSFATQKNTINLRFEDIQQAASFVENLETAWTNYNADNPDAAFYGAYRFFIAPSQGCVMILPAS